MTLISVLAVAALVAGLGVVALVAGLGVVALISGLPAVTLISVLVVAALVSGLGVVALISGLAVVTLISGLAVSPSKRSSSLRSGYGGVVGELRVVLTGLIMGESARWHDGTFWFCDWVAGEIIRLDGESPTVVGRMSGLPFCIDWLPGGELLVLDGPGARLLRDGTVFADLSGIDGAHPWNDIAADSRGNVFVNNIGYDFPGGEAAPGLVAVVTPDGVARQVADGLLFPNGMAITPDDATLIVAESHGGRLTAFDIAPDGDLSGQRVWAELPGAAPDGICIDAEGAVWYADVPNRRCVRVREGGEVLATVPCDRGAFDCALSGDGQTLYAVTADFSDPQKMFTSRTGQVVATPIPRI